MTKTSLVHPEAVRHPTRPGDPLFELCRVANDDGASDVLWVPGAGRGK